MEFSLEVRPNQQAIHLVDEMMRSYIAIYDLPHKRELSFVLHELVINAVEAMENVKRAQGGVIRVQVVQDGPLLQMVVIDCAGGIPKEKWDQLLTYDVEEMGDSDRGRGLFFVQNMVDHIWFEYVAPEQFLVGVSKKLEI